MIYNFECLACRVNSIQLVYMLVFENKSKYRRHIAKYHIIKEGNKFNLVNIGLDDFDTEMLFDNLDSAIDYFEHSIELTNNKKYIQGY